MARFVPAVEDSKPLSGQAGHSASHSVKKPAAVVTLRTRLGWRARTYCWPATPSDGTVRGRLRIQKMDCPTEERLVRDKFEGAGGLVTNCYNTVR